MNNLSLDLTPVLLVATIMFCALIFGIALVVAIMKRRAMEMDIYKKAIDKGLPVPDFKVAKTPERTLKSALVWIAVGIGFSLVVLTSQEYEGIGVCSIPILIGIALIISYKIEKNAEREDDNKTKSESSLM